MTLARCQTLPDAQTGGVERPGTVQKEAELVFIVLQTGFDEGEDEGFGRFVGGDGLIIAGALGGLPDGLGGGFGRDQFRLRGTGSPW